MQTIPHTIQAGARPGTAMACLLVQDSVRPKRACSMRRPEPLSNGGGGPSTGCGHHGSNLSRGVAMTATEKLLCSGKTHVSSGPTGAAKSSDGFLDLKLPKPHPAAEQLFGAAWSACFMGA